MSSPRSGCPQSHPSELFCCSRSPDLSHRKSWTVSDAASSHNSRFGLWKSDLETPSASKTMSLHVSRFWTLSMPPSHTDSMPWRWRWRLQEAASGAAARMISGCYPQLAAAEGRGSSRQSLGILAPGGGGGLNCAPNHLEERLLDQAQVRASYTPLFGGHSRSIPQGMIFDLQPLVKSLFCPIRPSPNGCFDCEASIL